MDKPVNLSVKHWIIRNMSVKTMMQERVIETVVNHQFDSAYNALDNCYSMEFSGFGKLYFNEKKAKKKLEKYKSQMELFKKMLSSDELSPLRRRNIELKLETAKKNLEHLRKKIKDEESGMGADIRGVEEQADSPKQA